MRANMIFIGTRYYKLTTILLCLRENIVCSVLAFLNIILFNQFFVWQYVLTSSSTQVMNNNIVTSLIIVNLHENVQFKISPIIRQSAISQSSFRKFIEASPFHTFAVTTKIWSDYY